MPQNDPFGSKRSLFVLTDPDLPSGEAIDRALAATRGGATHIVVRRPNDTAEGVARMANELSPARCNGDWKMLVHDRIDVALATQAQGAMLRLGGIPSGAKERLGEDRMMGVSVHTLGQAQSAHLKSADFVIFGNVYETESHPGKPGVGLEALASVARDTDLPVVAIGGVTAERVDEVLSTGASGVAVIRAVSRADDPEAETRRIREAVDAANYPHLTQGEIMTLTVNNDVLQIDRETLTIDTFLRERGIPATSIVIAVNDDVVPRNEWEATALRDGDIVDIVQAVSGGDHDDTLTIAGQAFSSRLFLGTGKYPDNDTMVRALDASGAEMVTIAIRFMNLDGENGGGAILDQLDLSRYRLLPNTAGAYTVKDAVKMARLARAATGTEWIKLEVIGDQRTLWPDVAATTEATRILVEDGFVVLPYTSPDLVAALRLEEAGAATVMPLASPIGSGAGMQDWKSIERIVRAVSVPVVVDAGIGVPSDASLAMELGADAVLVNTAVAKASNPVAMARGMRLGVEAGRLAHLAGRMPISDGANPSSPTTGVPVETVIE